MSKSRTIKTDFWSDSFVESLDPTEKLLFIYLFSNEKVDLCGIYELSLKKISFESGIDLKQLPEILEKFSKNNKFHYIDGYVVIVNFTKHQKTNPSIEEGIKRSLDLIPQHIKAKIDRLGTECRQTGDSDLHLYSYLTHTLPNLDLTCASDFFDKMSKTTYEQIGKQLNRDPIELLKFYNYYTQKKNGKPLWQMYNVFGIEEQIDNWFLKTFKKEGIDNFAHMISGFNSDLQKKIKNKAIKWLEADKTRKMTEGIMKQIIESFK